MRTSSTRSAPAARLAALVLCSLVLLAAANACRPRTGASAGGDGETPADSLSLERTACFGTCPMYRVSVDVAGRIRFVSRNPQDSTAPPITDSLPADSARALLVRAAQLDFSGFPESIREDSTWCALQATDHPGVYLNIHYAGGQSRRFDDYLGCHPPEGSDAARKLSAVRAFEAAVDTVLNTARWARPPQFRD
jgi:hypothetical protein